MTARRARRGITAVSVWWDKEGDENASEVACCLRCGRRRKVAKSRNSQFCIECRGYALRDGWVDIKEEINE